MIIFLFPGYCSNLAPRKHTIKLIDKITKEVKEYQRYEFNTYTFRSLKWIHDLFYKKGIKIIDPKLEKYLTPLALAIWIMDSGKVYKNLLITTSIKSKKDLKILVNLLMKKYDISCNIVRYNDSNYAISIPNSSINSLIRIVNPQLSPILFNILKRYIKDKI